MAITYQNNLDGIELNMLEGFFIDWYKKPSNEKFYQILNQSTYISLAINNNQVVGFINAISDKILSAYIPLLEVLPEFQDQGIGKQLVIELEKQINHLYMIDICCDDNIVSFYEKIGYMKVNGMIKRNYSVI